MSQEVEHPKVEQWMREAAEEGYKLWNDWLTRLLRMESPYPVAELKAKFAEIIASHAPTPAQPATELAETIRTAVYDYWSSSKKHFGQTHMQDLLRETIVELLRVSAPASADGWGWIVKQVHSHKPILDCPQCHATSAKKAENLCTGNEDNCPMDSARSWVETLVRLNIDTIAVGFYGDPDSPAAPVEEKANG